MKRLFSSNGTFTSKEELIEIVSKLDREKVTGALIIKNESIERSIFFDDGRIVFAHSNSLNDSLGQYLLVHQKINREQLNHASTVVQQSGKRLGRALLEMGVLGYDTLWESVVSHLKGIVTACFTHDNGDYTIIPGHRLPDENIILDLSVGNLVWGIMDTAKIPQNPEQYLTDMEKVYVTDCTKLSQIEMTPYQLHIVKLIERYHSLDMVIRQSELLPVDTQRILAVLKIGGMIGGEPEETAAADSVADVSSAALPFSSFDEALKHYNTLYELIFKMLKKEIGPIAMSISQNALEEIRGSLPGPFKKVEIMPDGKLSDQLLQKTIWFGDMTKKIAEFISALDEILYAQIYAVKKNLGNEHEQQVLRWVRGDRN